MLPEKIMQSDLLDILFENRNKNYGAYALRKSYNKILITSIMCTLFVTACFCVLQFLHHTKKLHVTTINISIPDVNLSKAPKNISKPSPQHTQAAAHVKQANNSAPQIVPDNVQTKLPPTTTDLDKAVIGPINLNGKDNAGIIEPPIESLKGTGSVITTTSEKISEDKPVKFAEVMPEFPGGANALIKFILKSIHQPDDLQPGEQIKVIASLVVSKTGAVENVKIVSSGRADLDKEVLRVINKMPVWKPGMQNGKPVSVYFNLPVTFQTANE
jgi:protein TonB